MSYWLRSGLALITGVLLIILDYYGPRLVESSGVISPEGQLFWSVIAIITLGVMLFSGRVIYAAALRNLKHLSFTMDTLILIGTFAAWIFSVIVIMIPHLIPEAATSLYFDASVMILAFINLGHGLEARGKKQASEAVERLLDLSPQIAIRVSKLGDEEIPVDQVKLGDVLRVKPGAQVPVDGLVVEGDSYIDESMMTGEPLAVHKQKDDAVIAGSLNQKGSFLFKATAVGEETMLAKMAQAVEDAQGIKPEIGRLADKISSVFVPAVILIALVTAIVWTFVAPDPKIPFVLATSIAVLVIACPCSLGLATPMAIIAGVGRAAGLGVLIRNGDALQRSKDITHVVLDKTGAITQGRPKLNRILSVDDAMSSKKLLQLAASLEAHSEHPLAKAVLDAAHEEGLELLEITGFEATAGHGVMGELQGEMLYIGNQRLINTLGLSLDGIDQQALAGMSVLYIARKNNLLGALGVADAVKEDSAEAVKRLQNLGLTVVMLTGDRLESATAVAKSVGIMEVIADVLPQQKQEKIAELQAQGHVVAMVGDGVNDAPALAQADVSLAMGSGSDIAIAAADIALLRHSVTGVVDAIRISQLTMRNIKQNLFGAMVYNSLGIPIAAGVFYPAFHLLLHPIVASLAMALSSVTVVSNALRLRYAKL
ncbi:copper-translocating P-type ATPase [Piscirickettsia litoralis]|uniref:P-type Cu(+) transporter n=1 Tax=Piscirickettsia litoralis TaxID=1891921 RepID=A0ABX3A3N6_9GAMM|nr:copper-translocating P-type ATPase [Piscirickettsia litoralis]ODN43482.1 copper-transporting ATPase [Piscirickettsia litoralis]